MGPEPVKSSITVIVFPDVLLRDALASKDKIAIFSLIPPPASRSAARPSVSELGLFLSASAATTRL